MLAAPSCRVNYHASPATAIREAGMHGRVFEPYGIGLLRLRCMATCSAPWQQAREMAAPTMPFQRHRRSTAQETKAKAERSVFREAGECVTWSFPMGWSQEFLAMRAEAVCLSRSQW